MFAAPAALADDATPQKGLQLDLERTTEAAPATDADWTLAHVIGESDRVQSVSGASEYCTRAIDIAGAFCFIGCSEGCRCHVETFYSQCCCSTAR